MKSHALDYSLKVWLTSVLVAPAIYIIVQGYIEYNHNAYFKDYLNPLLYIPFVLFELILSFVIWLLFWGVIELIIWYCQVEELQRWLIFICAIILTIAPPTLLWGIDCLTDYNNWMFVPMMSNVFCIGWGCWFYTLHETK